MTGASARYAATLAGVALLTVAVSGTALAQGDAAAGRFIAVTGEVKIVGADGATRDAERGGEFRQGESIVTGANALAQVRMTDGGALSVRAESQLKLEGYRFQGNDDPEPSFFASLIKGGFRTITGLIGRGRRDSYRVATTSATMGIRGTHFEIVHVVQQAPGVAPGTYNRVYDGIVAIQNRAGAELLVTRDQTVFVALPGNVAPVLVRPPAGIYSKPTPVPIFKPQARDEGDAAAHKDSAAHKAVAPRVREALGNKDAPAILAPRTAQPLESAPSLSPIEAPKTTISPTLTSPLLTPIDTPTTTTISPTLTAPTTTTISPTTTTISPTTTTISPTTTTISPTTTTISPTTTTISPTTTTISPTTTTISPTLTSPTTTTISPTLTSPTTTTISPTTTTISPTTTTISPTLTAPSTTTISPTLTAPTTTIKK